MLRPAFADHGLHVHLLLTHLKSLPVPVPKPRIPSL